MKIIKIEDCRKCPYRCASFLGVYCDLTKNYLEIFDSESHRLIKKYEEKFPYFCPLEDLK